MKKAQSGKTYFSAQVCFDQYLFHWKINYEPKFCAKSSAIKNREWNLEEDLMINRVGVHSSPATVPIAKIWNYVLHKEYSL